MFMAVNRPGRSVQVPSKQRGLRFPEGVASMMKPRVPSLEAGARRCGDGGCPTPGVDLDQRTALTLGVIGGGVQGGPRWPGCCEITAGRILEGAGDLGTFQSRVYQMRPGFEIRWLAQGERFELAVQNASGRAHARIADRPGWGKYRFDGPEGDYRLSVSADGWWTAYVYRSE
jgi:hypothetical protein